MPQFSQKGEVHYPCLHSSPQHQTHLYFLSAAVLQSPKGKTSHFSGLKELGGSTGNASTFLTVGGEQRGKMWQDWCTCCGWLAVQYLRYWIPSEGSFWSIVLDLGPGSIPTKEKRHQFIHHCNVYAGSWNKLPLRLWIKLSLLWVSCASGDIPVTSALWKTLAYIAEEDCINFEKNTGEEIYW